MGRKIGKLSLLALVGFLAFVPSVFADPESATVSLNAIERGDSARVRLRFVYTGDTAVTSDAGCVIRIRGCTYRTGSEVCTRSRVISRRTLARGKRKFVKVVILPTIAAESEEDSKILAMQVRTECPGADAFESTVDAANVSCDGGVTATQFLTQLRSAFR